MNSKKLVMRDCSVQHSGVNVVPTEVSLNDVDETCTLVFDDFIPEGRAVLNMSFKGKHEDEKEGFYRNKVMNNGVESYNLVTQFWTTYARQCFPCWDEPALKATFQVTLNVPENLVALSNMNIVSEDVLKDGVTKKVVFARSMKMSTYLLAFVVGEFDYVQGKTNNDVEIKVYTPPGKASQGKYPLEVAIKSVEHFTEFFYCPYPMNKLDLIAITDSEFAMENWGLITFQESKFLIDENESSVAQKQMATTEVCHEVSHQWFGNLVTMEWWTHWWLNEGVATFMENEATNFCNPGFKIWEQYVSKDTIFSLELDSLKNSHAIGIRVNHPKEVYEMCFDIAYKKGSNIIRMVYFWIGAEHFKKGIKLYFEKNAYSNTLTEEFWNCLEIASGEPVKQVMSTWTKQMGFPVIDVSVASRNDNSVTLNVSQRKFSLSTRDEGSQSLWQVPIAITTSANYYNASKKHQSYILTSKSDQITVEGVSPNDWFKINPGFCGFYRVNYSQEILSKLIGAIENNELNCFDLLNILNDVSTMAFTCQVSFANYFDMLKMVINVKSYPVWKEIIKSMSAIQKVLWNDDEASKKFSQFKKNLLSNIMAHIGMEAKQNESHLDASLRSLLITASNDDRVNQKCVEIMKNFFHTSTPVDPEIRGSVYQVYVSKGGLEACNKMVGLHKNVYSMEEKKEIETALGCVEGLDCLKKVQQFMMESHVNDNEKYEILKDMATGSKLGRDVSWDFVKEQWKVFYGKYKRNDQEHLLSRIVVASTENFATEEMLEDVKNFLKSSWNRETKLCVEKIMLNIHLWKKTGQALKEYFK